MTQNRRRRRNQRRGQGRDWSQAVVWLVLAVIGTVVTVVAATVLVPAAPDDEAPVGEEALDDATLYERHCGICHGAQGQGNIGPQLGGGAVVDRYPDLEDQLAVIRDGRGSMPAFGGSLSEEEIRAIALYTRSLELPAPATSAVTTSTDSG